MNSWKTSNLRGQVWKALLGIYRISAIDYVRLIERGVCPVVAEKIDNDVFRTLATDKSFQKNVSNDMITRVLNAFVWKAQGLPSFLNLLNHIDINLYEW